MTLTLAGSECWVRIGWTMLHFLWIGSLVGLGAWTSKWALKAADAGARYLAALGWLALLAALPLAIALSVEPAPTTESPPVSLGPERYLPGALAVPSSEVVTSRSPPGLGSAVPSARLSAPEEAPTGGGFQWATLSWTGLATALPWIWLFCSPLVFAWSMVGLAGAERLRRVSSPIRERNIEELCRRLVRSLKISREVSIAVCARISSPLLVGIVRPAILLPPALLSGLTPEQIEMLLLHELAHVRRWDNLVNFVQRLIESLLFFHPAVWLVSSWARHEREHCCDELVLGRLGDRESYAETLLAVVRRGLAGRRLKLALATVAGGPASAMGRRDVRSRIDRILRWEDKTMQVSRRLGLVVPVALLAAVAIGTMFGLSQGRAGPRGESAPAIPAEAKSEAPPQKDGSQEEAVGRRQHGVFHTEYVYSGMVEVPGDYVRQLEGSSSPYTLLLSENPTPGDIQARDGAVSKIKWPTFPSERVPFEPGALPRPSSRHPGGVNRFRTDPWVDDTILFPQYTNIINSRSTDSRAGHVGVFTPYPRIVLPYELGGDYVVNQDPTISSPFVAQASSAPDTSAEPPPEEEQPKPGSQGAVRWVNQRKKVVWIGLGCKDGLERGTQFRVYDRAKEDGTPGEEKGTIVITRILDDHLSEARIEQDKAGIPIMPGDPIRSPQWKGQGVPMPSAETSAAAEPDDASAALRKQVEALRQELRRLHEERDQLFDDRVRLTDELNALRVEHQRLDQIMKRVEKSERLKAFLELLGREPPVLQPDVEGVVLEVGAHGVVEVSLGSDDGLHKGQWLEVYRPQTMAMDYYFRIMVLDTHRADDFIVIDREIDYAGRIEVLEIQPDRAVCRILAEFLQRPVQKGDRVAIKLPEGGGAAVSRPARQPDARSPEVISITISIDATGEITLKGTPVALRELPEVLCSAVSDPARVHLWIAAHPEVEYSRIVELITECSKAGIPKFSFMAHPDTRDTRAPATEPKSETPQTDADTLNIDAEGQITLNGVKITSDVLREGKRLAGSRVLVVAHPDANHERVVEVLDACAQAGIAGVRLAVPSDVEPTRPLPVPRGELKSPLY